MKGSLLLLVCFAALAVELCAADSKSHAEATDYSRQDIADITECYQNNINEVREKVQAKYVDDKFYWMFVADISDKDNESTVLRKMRAICGSMVHCVDDYNLETISKKLSECLNSAHEKFELEISKAKNEDAKDDARDHLKSKKHSCYQSHNPVKKSKDDEAAKTAVKAYVDNIGCDKPASNSNPHWYTCRRSLETLNHFVSWLSSKSSMVGACDKHKLKHASNIMGNLFNKT